MVWALGALALAVAALVVWLPDELSTSEQPASTEVFPVDVELPRVPRSEAMFAAIDPNRDRWQSEAVNEELESKLGTITKALVDGEPVTEELPALEERLDGIADVSYAKFKVVAVDLDDGGGGLARTRALFELDGRGEDGALVTRRHDADIRWRHANGEWEITELTLDPGTELRSPAPYFTDVSALAFAHVDSYRRQLALGINDYRTRLDAASGIDVFAHNGVSIADVDGDGLEDLFVAQPAGLPNRLYRNLGDGTFEDASERAGVDVLDRTSMGLFADFDNDGDEDLALILQNAAPVLFVNDGRGSFSRAPSRFERADGADTTRSSASAADYDGDGLVDLYVCSYLTVDAPGADKELPLPYPYHDADNGAANVLFRNLGDGRFEDATRAAGLDAGNHRFSLAASWSDYNDDGRPDLYVANDFGRNNLYENAGGGRFRDVSAEAGVEDLGAGMSVAWGDYDNDGRDDLYVGNMWSSAGQRLTHQAGYHTSELRASYARHAKGNTLFRNVGDGSFEDVTARAGVELGRWAWGSDFFDADNDGDEDLYIANGYITNRSDRDL